MPAGCRPETLILERPRRLPAGMVTDCLYDRPLVPATPGTPRVPGTPGVAPTSRQVTATGTRCPSPDPGESLLSQSVTRTRTPDRADPRSGTFCYYRHPGAAAQPPLTVLHNYGTATVPYDTTRAASDRLDDLPLFAATTTAGAWTADWVYADTGPSNAGAGNIAAPSGRARLESFAFPVWRRRADSDFTATPTVRTGIVASVQYADTTAAYTRATVTVVAKSGGTVLLGAVTRAAPTVFIPVASTLDQAAEWTIEYRDGAAATAAAAAALSLLSSHDLPPAPDSLPSP